MNELSLTQNEALTMSSREIAELTGKQLGHVHRDFKSMISELGYELPSNPFLDLDDTPFNNVNTEIVSITEAAKIIGKARKTIYAHANAGKIKLCDGGVHINELNRFYGAGIESSGDAGGIKGDCFEFVMDGQKRITEILMNQELTMTLVSGYNIKLRNAIVKRWQDLESKNKPANEAFQIPQTLGEALQLAADQAKQLELAAPKVKFVENLVDRTNLMTATQIAQKHKISAIKLNKLLDELGGVYSKGVKRGRVFIQSFIDSGYGEIKQTEMGYSQALFTPAGELYIYEKLINEGII